MYSQKEYIYIYLSINLHDQFIVVSGWIDDMDSRRLYDSKVLFIIHTEWQNSKHTRRLLVIVLEKETIITY